MKSVSTPSAPAAIGPYSQAKIVGNLLFTAGQIPLVPETMEMVTGSIEAQTERVLQNLARHPEGRQHLLGPRPQDHGVPHGPERFRRLQRRLRERPWAAPSRPAAPSRWRPCPGAPRSRSSSSPSSSQRALTTPRSDGAPRRPPAPRSARSRMGPRPAAPSRWRPCPGEPRSRSSSSPSSSQRALTTPRSDGAPRRPPAPRSARSRMGPRAHRRCPWRTSSNGFLLETPKSDILDIRR